MGASGAQEETALVIRNRGFVVVDVVVWSVLPAGALALAAARLFDGVWACLRPYSDYLAAEGSRRAQVGA